MSPSAAAPDNAPVANLRNRVFVTGAGFTRALVPKAPLLVDDFGNDALADRVIGLPNASRLLEWERNRDSQGHINIERLMTRLESLMPYDFADFAGNAANEYALLLSELKLAFLDRIREAKKGKVHRDDLNHFARYCGANGCHCISFNYDDLLDEALFRSSHWRPLDGYGFHCPSSRSEYFRDDWNLGPSRLLKLHGSINWRAKLGHAEPVPLDAITHHDAWSGIGSAPLPQVDHRLEPEPIIVPPVLSKSGLVQQPILRLVWSRAFSILQSAHEVTFVGYSFPTTDLAARSLFSEALKDLPRGDIRVVNLAKDEFEANAARTAYRSALGEIPDSQFEFCDALDWIRRLPS